MASITMQMNVSYFVINITNETSGYNGNIIYSLIKIIIKCYNCFLSKPYSRHSYHYQISGISNYLHASQINSVVLQPISDPVTVYNLVLIPSAPKTRASCFQEMRQGNHNQYHLFNMDRIYQRLK